MKLSPIITIAFLLLAAAGVARAERPFIVFDPCVPEELKLSDEQKTKLVEKLPGFQTRYLPLLDEMGTNIDMGQIAQSLRVVLGGIMRFGIFHVALPAQLHCARDPQRADDEYDPNKFNLAHLANLKCNPRYMGHWFLRTGKCVASESDRLDFARLFMVLGVDQSGEVSWPQHLYFRGRAARVLAWARHWLKPFLLPKQFLLKLMMPWASTYPR